MKSDVVMVDFVNELDDAILALRIVAGEATDLAGGALLCILRDMRRIESGMRNHLDGHPAGNIVRLEPRADDDRPPAA